MKKFLTKCDDEERVSNLFAMAVYGMVIFPKVSNHIEAVVVDLVEQVNSQANLVSAIIVEIMRSLNYFHKEGKG